MTPLVRAAIEGHGPVVELLLSKGANPNINDNVSTSPVQWVVL